VALDVVPYPIDWNNLPRFKALSAFVLAKAAALNVPIVWGGNWPKLKDMPHYELGPSWRTWAAKSKPFEG
jgi:peptidoglycan L-alanyl-D-glutamate endopeptidase CwlK